VQKNQFPEIDKPAHFEVFTINFTVWSHRLSAGGDALISLWWWRRVLLAWNSSFNLSIHHNHTTTAGAHKLCYIVEGLVVISSWLRPWGHTLASQGIKIKKHKNSILGDYIKFQITYG
jgi:hypothetical protein